MDYLQVLQKDQHLRQLIRKHGPVQLGNRGEPYLYLMYSIMSQQLSTQVATVLKRRLHELAETTKPSASWVLEQPMDSLKSIGLSASKANYLQQVAHFSLEEGLSRRKLQSMTDEEIISYVTQIKGVGRWTAEMLLIFCLGRKDVFPADDYGIQQAMINLYSLDTGIKSDLLFRMREISYMWSPFRSYASLYLWAWRDNAL